MTDINANSRRPLVSLPQREEKGGRGNGGDGFKPTELGDLPAEWEVVRLGDVAKLSRFLTVAGGVIGLTILATGALRNTLISIEVLPKETFPPEMVLAYGAYFTIILALVYLPAYNALRSVGLQICEALLPFPALEADAFGKWYSARKNFESFLQLEVTAWQNAQTSLAIFAPLLGGAISLLVGK